MPPLNINEPTIVCESQYIYIEKETPEYRQDTIDFDFIDVIIDLCEDMNNLKIS